MDFERAVKRKAIPSIEVISHRYRSRLFIRIRNRGECKSNISGIDIGY